MKPVQKVGAEIDDFEFECAGETPPAVPSGDNYIVAFKRSEMAHQWGQHKVYLRFVIVPPDKLAGTELFMVCTVPKQGKWGVSHKYWLMWTLAAGQRPKRGDRMSTKVFRGKYFRASVRLVTKKSGGGERTLAQQYSVIDSLVEVVAGGNQA